MDLDDFVEMTKRYAQGIVPSAPQNVSQVPAKTESPTPQDSGVEVKDQHKIEMIYHHKDTRHFVFHYSD